MTSELTSRKHGPFDTRYPHPSTPLERPNPEPKTDTSVVDTWEAEGGRIRSPGHPKRASLPEGLTWESFAALAYPGAPRHHFPAIAAWLRYGDRDRSHPQAQADRPRPRHGAIVERAKAKVG
jgi:hypothetical protein